MSRRSQPKQYQQQAGYSFQHGNSGKLPPLTTAELYHNWTTELTKMTTLIQKVYQKLEKHLQPTEMETIASFVDMWNKCGDEIGLKWQQVQGASGSQTTQQRYGNAYAGYDQTATATAVAGAALVPQKHGSSARVEAREQLPQVHIAQVTDTIERLQLTIKGQKQQIEEQKQQIKDLETNMSKMMNQKLSEDETQIENISLKNRPLKLVEDYNNLCCHQWMAAKEAITKKAYAGRFDEKKQCGLLNDILIKSYEYMKIQYGKQRETLRDVLNDPFWKKKEEFNPSGMSPKPNKPSTGDKNDSSQVDICFTPELDMAISNYLKQQSDGIRFETCAPDILAKVSTTLRTDEIKSIGDSTQLQKYCTAACELSWKMIIQRPPMVFHTAGVGDKFDPQIQELSLDSKDPSQPGTKVDYYIYPAICHGEPSKKGTLLKKGRVCVTLFHGSGQATQPYW